MLFKTYLYMLALWSLAPGLLAQSADECLYGTITLKNGQKHQGQMRWGNQEATWSDFLEAYKDKPQIQEKIEVQGNEDVGAGTDNGLFDLGFMQLWENRDPKSKFFFRCYFGQISRIVPLNDNEATIFFKENEKINLNRRGDDIGADITMFQEKVGKLTFPWKDIKSVDFSAAPKKVVNQFGYPIYGRLLTTDGTFEGYIIWDHEAAFSNDQVTHESGSIGMTYGQMASLKPESEGTRIWLKTGKQIFISGSPGAKAHGLRVKTKEFGEIRIDWADIVKIDFIPGTFKMKRYADFVPQNNLEGTVETVDSKSYTGKFIYDLDETWNFEILDGKSGGIRYYLPFYMVSKIEPQNYNYSLVTLKDGTQKLMGEAKDVCHRNNGILLWLTPQKTKFIPWDEVKRITFK